MNHNEGMVLRASRRSAVIATVVACIELISTSHTTAAAFPAFHSSVATVSTAALGKTWHRGCPVGASQLRAMQVRYVGFDHRAHDGVIVVNAAVTAPVLAVFRMLYAARFPIHSLVPESAFGGSDPASMAADNSSGFNCRLAVAAGPPQWSVHAYGEAIDINPVENPYVFNGVPDPAAGRAYLDRHAYRPGMAVAGGVLVDAFRAVGWSWGGRWSASPDYQHFSANGR
jgi:hypothetical protein